MAWKLFWLIWFLVGFIGEVIALCRPGRDDTLSEQIWQLVAIPGYGNFIAWMLSAFLLWAIVHFVTRGTYA